MSILKSTATELKRQLDAGELTSVEVCTAFLNQVNAHDEQIGAFLRVDRDAVLSAAAKIDKRRAAGEEIGKLSGLPVAVKDLLCTKGDVTTCASQILKGFVPPYDATVIRKLREADAVLFGKTNMDEFAMGGSTENSSFKVARNPWDVSRVPGGSSGGAAACVAASMAPLSIGTDTGGSIRQPASFCGVVGLKPTYGRVSRFGLVAFASSLDQIGPLAHTVEDVALLLEVIAGHDSRDSTSIQTDVPVYTDSVAKPLQGLKLGLAKEFVGDGVDSEVTNAVQEALSVYKNLGAEIVDISLPHSPYGIATYYIIAPSEASSNLSRYDGVHYGHRSSDGAVGDADESPLVTMYRRSRSEGFGPEVKRRIMLGAYALSAGYYDAYYLKALKVRRLIRQDYDAAFEKVDFVVGPVTPAPAFKIGERTDDPLAMYLEDLFTVTANLAGIAGISIPCGFTTQGLPIGLQLQAKPLDEQRLMQAAHMFQSETDWHGRRPVL